MEYITLNNWKKLKKQKKYKEAAYALYDEIAYNLLRVHNKYSNIHLDENKYYKSGDLTFSKEIVDGKKFLVKELNPFLKYLVQ